MGDVKLARRGVDTHVGGRTGWLMDQCELAGVHILNGGEHQEPAQFTCNHSRGSSTVDYIMSPVPT